MTASTAWRMDRGECGPRRRTTQKPAPPVFSAQGKGSYRELRQGPENPTLSVARTGSQVAFGFDHPGWACLLLLLPASNRRPMGPAVLGAPFAAAAAAAAADFTDRSDGKSERCQPRDRGDWMVRGTRERRYCVRIRDRRQKKTPAGWRGSEAETCSPDQNSMPTPIRVERGACHEVGRPYLRSTPPAAFSEFWNVSVTPRLLNTLNTSSWMVRLRAFDHFGR